MTSFDKKIKEKIVKLKKEKNRMFIGRNKIEIINKKDNIKCEVTNKKPEILMLDCDKEESDRLKEKGFNIW